MKNTNYLAPEYYQQFSCKLDKCRHTCCYGWKIPISHSEYNKLITMNCSDELNQKVQRTFVIPDVVSEECYRYITFNYLGYCPIQNNGLCSLHKEKGEDYLPKVCKLYPRSLKTINDVNIASCSNSCEAVVDLLFDADNLNIKEITLNEEPNITYSVTNKDIEQIKLLNNILKDRTTSLVQSLKNICLIINKDEFEKDYASNVEPLSLAIQILKRLSYENDRLNELTLYLEERYKDKKTYINDQHSFEQAYPKWMELFERLINNSMIYECFPFVDKRIDKTNSYKGLCLCYGLLRVICIGTYSKTKIKEDLIDNISLLFHLIDHTAFYYNAYVICENAAKMLKL